MYVRRRQPRNTLGSARNHEQISMASAGDLDRPKRRAWIVAVSAMAIAPACSGVTSGDEGVDTSGSALAVEGPWRPSAEARVIGADVRVSYDDAPVWTGTAGCGSGLKEGARRLGNSLRTRFPAISSIGGFACRRNAANSSKTSVHGTGRALDVFIPKTGGSADNGKGDPVANWLIMNAEKIGVQLIIWDRTVWHSDGRNDTRYTGPHPHDDHIHVEVTNEAAAMKTPFFENGETTDPGPAEPESESESEETDPPDTEEDPMLEPEGSSSGSTSSSGGTSSGSTSSSGGTSGSTSSGSTSGSTSSGSTSSGSTSSSGGSSSGTTPKPPPEPAPVEPPATEPEPETTQPSAPQEGEIEPEQNDDGPGERNSIGGSTSKTKKSSASNGADYSMASSGCSVATTPTGSAGSPFVTIALGAFVLGIVRRRRD